MKLPDGYTPGVGVVKSSGFGGFGERMLKTFGWEEGKGLGKAEQGMSTAIEIRKKDDQIGVGFGPDRNWNAWWENAYEEAAKGVRVASGAGSSRRCHGSDKGCDSSDDSDSSDDDEEVHGRKTVNRDGTVATGSADELRLLASLAKAGGRVAAGRFGGRDAKMERIRRQEELEAQRMREKLGLVEATPKAAGDGVAADRGDAKKEKKEKKEKRREDGKANEKKAKKAKEGKEAKKGKEGKEGKEERTNRRRIVIECGEREGGIEGRKMAPMAALQPTPASGWWGCNLFRSAGALDSSPMRKSVEDPAVGFSEDQQAKIYENAQLGKTSGKTGLGKGRRGTIKIEGAVWKGTKVTFDDADGVVGQADDGHVQDGNDGLVASKKVLSKGKKLNKQNKKKPSGEQGSKEEIQWKKVVKRALKTVKRKKKGSNEQAKLKSLHKEVASHLVTKYDGIVIDDAQVRVEVERCISAKGSSYTMSACGKYVKLKI